MQSPLSWEQIGTILFFGGFAWWAIKFTGRNLRAQIGADAMLDRPSELAPEVIDEIVRRGLATPVQLMSMSPNEQRLLATTVLALGVAGKDAPGSGHATGAGGALGAPSTSGAAGAGRESRARTPVLPPRVHCPHCGTLVENFPVSVPWKCTCAGCGCALVLRPDAGRLLLSYTPKA